jgi:charged multivesicular body protein 6
MLAGSLSNQDEDEVEDELEALRREVQGPVSLPNVPTAPPEVEVPEEELKKQKARAKARAREQAAIPAS